MFELTPAQQQQLDRNIKGMIANGASQGDVERYASDFTAKFGKKKEQTSPQNGGNSSNGTVATSPSKFVSPSPLPQAQPQQPAQPPIPAFQPQQPIAQPSKPIANDALTQAASKGQQVIAQKNEVAAKKFNKEIGSSFIPQDDEIVTLQDGTRVNVNDITTLAGRQPVKDKAALASLLQLKVNTKTFNDLDVATLASGARVIPELVKAKIKNDKLDIAVATIKNEKNNFDNSLRESIGKTNGRFALNDAFEEVTSSPAKTRAYLSKVQGLREEEARKAEEARRLISMQQGDVRSVTKFDAVDKEDEALSNLVGQMASLAKNNSIEQIAADDNLTREEKLEQTLAVLNGRQYNYAKTALAGERESTVVEKILKGASIIGVARYLTEDTDYDRKENKEALRTFEGAARLSLSEKLSTRYEKENLQLAQEERAVIASGQATDEDIEKFRSRRVKLDALATEIESTEDIYNEFPSLKKAEVTRLINDYKALTSGNLDEKTTNSDEEIAALKSVGINGYLKAKGVNLDDEIVKDAIEEDRTKTYSWFGGSGKALADVFRSSRKSVGDLIGARDDISILGEKRLDELFPTTISENDKFQLDAGTKLTQNVGQTTAQVIGQGILQYGTAGLGRAVGAAKAASAIGSWSSGVLTSYDAAYKEAYDFTDSKLARTTYAGLIAIATAAAEKTFNEAKIIEAIPGVKQNAIELARSFGTEGFTDAMTNAILKKTQKAIVDYGKSYVKNVGQEMVEEGGTSVFTDGLKFLYGDKAVSFARSMENLKETAIQTATGMIFIGGVGASVDLKARRNASEAGTLYNAALYKDEATAAIEKGFETGLYGEAERNAKMVVLNTAVSKMAEVKRAEDVLGRAFTRGEKQLFVSNLTAEAVYKEQQKNSTSDEVKAEIQVKLDNLKSQQKEIFKGGVTVADDGTIETGPAPAPETQQSTPSDSALPEVSQQTQVAPAAPLALPELIESLDEANYDELAKIFPAAANAQQIADDYNAVLSIPEDKRTDDQNDKVFEIQKVLAMQQSGVVGNAEIAQATPDSPAQEEVQAAAPTFTPAPLKESLTPEEQTEIRKGIRGKQAKELFDAQKNGEADNFLLKIANDRIIQQNESGRIEFESNQAVQANAGTAQEQEGQGGVSGSVNPDGRGNEKAAPAVQLEEVGKLVDARVEFNGELGVIRQDEGGKLTFENDSKIIELDGTEQAAAYAAPAVKFDNGKVTIGEENYDYVSANENKKGEVVSVTLKKPNGKNVTIREADTVLAVGRAKAIAERSSQEDNKPPTSKEDVADNGSETSTVVSQESNSADTVVASTVDAKAQEIKQAASKINLDLKLVPQGKLPQKQVKAVNKNGVVIGMKSVPDKNKIAEQDAINKKLETLKNVMECLIG